MNRRNFAKMAWTGVLAQQLSTARAQDNRKPILVLPNYAALRSYDGEVEEVKISDPNLVGNFRRAAVAVSSNDNGGTTIVDALGRRWRRIFTGQIDFRWFGVTGGTDDSASVQRALDAEKGKAFLVPRNLRCIIAGVKLDGPAYNGTRINCEGEFVLKPRPSTTSTNFGGAWVGLLIKDCDQIELTFRGDGQRTLQPDEEHVHLLGVAGATNLRIPSFECREIRGDGLYVSQSNWTEKSANTNGLIIGSFDALNKVSDGRNGISIISADNVILSNFKSINVGGIVGGKRQPGGFDIEPNHAWHSCTNIAIKSIEVSTEGTSGLAIQGITGTDVTRGVTVDKAKIVNSSAPEDIDGQGAETQTRNHTLLILSAADVKIRGFAGQFTRAYGDAVIVSDSKGVLVSGEVRRVRVGARIGADGRDAKSMGVLDSEIHIDASDISRYGISTGKVSRVRFSGRISDPTAKYYRGSLFGVHAIQYVQTDVVYSVSVDGNVDWDRSYRQDVSRPPVFKNVVIRDAELEGVWRGITQQVGDMNVPRINMRGVEDRRR